MRCRVVVPNYYMVFENNYIGARDTWCNDPGEVREKALEFGIVVSSLTLNFMILIVMLPTSG